MTLKINLESICETEESECIVSNFVVSVRINV